MVRAKFFVTEVLRGAGQDGNINYEKIAMNAVSSNDKNDENHKFWQATPNGTLNMWVNNPEIFNTFLPGQQYYIDFTPVVNA